MGSLFGGKKSPVPTRVSVPAKTPSKGGSPAGSPPLDPESPLRRQFSAVASAERLVDFRGLVSLLRKSPAAVELRLTSRMVDDFLAAAPPAPSAPMKPAKSGMLPSLGSKKVKEIKGFTCAQYLELHEAMLGHFKETQRRGTIVIGNGRSVLGHEAGGAVDMFHTVVRFNDFQIEGYEKFVGVRTDLWVMSDYTAMKLLKKYETTRSLTLPVLIAIPWRFMGKDYYGNRRAELEEELKQALPEVYKRVTFVAGEVGKDLIGQYEFGDRWPSSGLLTIWSLLQSEAEREGGPADVFLHGFDFFKQIDGKIHYMEDTHKANHDAKQEERVCQELCKEKRVHFIC